MTAAERQAARERCDKAIRGPWEQGEDKINGVEDRVIKVAHLPGCPCFDPQENGHCGGGHVVMRVHDKAKHYNNRLHDPANLALIAACRTDLPAALDALDEADKRIAELEEAVQIGKENCATLIGFMDGKDALLGKAEERIAALEADNKRMRGVLDGLCLEGIV